MPPYKSGPQQWGACPCGKGEITTSFEEPEHAWVRGQSSSSADITCLDCKSRYAIVASSWEVEGAPEKNRDLEYLFLVEQKDVDERERAKLAEVAAEHDLRRLRSALVEEAIRRVEAVKGEQRYSLAAKVFAFPDSAAVKAFIAGRHVKTWVTDAAKQRFDALTVYFGRTDDLAAKKARCDEMKRVRKELGLPLVRYTLQRTSMAALLERPL